MPDPPQWAMHTPESSCSCQSRMEDVSAHDTAAEVAVKPDRLACTSAMTHCVIGWYAQAVEVAPGDPHLFWSGAEDSEVRQYDTRCQ